MTKLLSMIIAATFAAASVSVMAQDKGKDAAKKPSAEECKKDPKLKGCEDEKKDEKKKDEKKKDEKKKDEKKK